MNDRIPAFEGRPVDHTVIKMAGAAPLDDLEGTTLSIDDCVQMISMFRVTRVDHQVDEKTGMLVRVQTLKPVEMALHPLDPGNPNDDGIIRAIPSPVLGELES